MDAGLIDELRSVVQPAVEQLIALAAERGLSRIAICQDGLEISIERPPNAPLARPIEETEPSVELEEAAVDNEHLMTPVLSTLVGVFRMRSAPEKTPASTVGAQVAVGQVLGYIESMRLSYEIHAPSAGRVAEILVEDGHPVEYGQALMVLEEAE